MSLSKMIRSGMRRRWQPSGWCTWRAGSSAANWTHNGSRIDDGRAGTSPPDDHGCENSVIIQARACLVPLRPTGAGPIDDVEVLRAGATASVLGHRVMAASTVGVFLRAFSFGHVRQLDRLAEIVLTRAWQAGARPGDGPMTIDADSTICEVYGHHKQGAAYGYTRKLGYHPLLATRANTGEVLHARQRTGKANTARGVPRFVDETIGRVRRAGAGGELVFRADAGFWSATVIDRLRAHDVRFSITVRQTKPVRAVIAAIPEATWTTIPYPDSGVAQVAQTPFRGDRLVVRRTRHHTDQGQLFPTWNYHAFVTDRPGSPIELDADHRRHAVIELAIRDAKHGTGLRHHPSGRFFANAAWLVLVCLAHNLLRWIAVLGLGARNEQIVAKTLRRTLLALPGRLTRSARRWTLHLPARWPWAHSFTMALARLRCVPHPGG
jgi:Transposase DDE domain group 1